MEGEERRVRVLRSEWWCGGEKGSECACVRCRKKDRTGLCDCACVRACKRAHSQYNTLYIKHFYSTQYDVLYWATHVRSSQLRPTVYNNILSLAKLRAGTLTYYALAGHEVSLIVSCVVAKHADETAYVRITVPRRLWRYQKSP